MTTTSLVVRPMESPVGELRLVASDTALVAVLWPNEKEGRVKFSSEPELGGNEVLAQTVQQIEQYFAGTRTNFELPLEPRGTDFQKQVWWSLAEIPFGETSTYGRQAQAIGRPKAVRAVGSANGRNPLSIVLPCHRIVGADGTLTGFAAGVDTKRWLLDHERTVATR